MTYEKEIESLKAYNNWVMEQKAKGVDVTPEAYMLDKAKTDALEKLIKVDEMIAALPEDLWADLNIREIADYINS